MNQFWCPIARIPSRSVWLIGISWWIRCRVSDTVPGAIGALLLLMPGYSISSPKRRVVIIPPANVWRHLSEMDASFGIGEGQQGLWGLERDKPARGLNDAPLRTFGFGKLAANSKL